MDQLWTRPIVSRGQKGDLAGRLNRDHRSQALKRQGNAGALSLVLLLCFSIGT